MKYFAYLIAVVLLLGLNLGFFSNLQIGGQIPNFLLLFSVFFALEKNSYDFFFVSFFSGVLMDFYSTGFFGAFTLGFLVVSLTLHIISNVFIVFELNWKSLSLMLLLALVVLNLVVWIYSYLVFKLNWWASCENFQSHTGGFLFSYFYNWVFLYPVYLFSSNLKRTLDNFYLRSKGVVR